MSINETQVTQDLYQLYAEFGIAAEKAQVLEIDAGNVALGYLALFFVKPGEVSAEQSKMFRSVVDDLNRKTLGTVLRHVKSSLNFDARILEIVDRALERRNYLTHKFFRTHNFAICSAEGRKAMIAELQEIQAQLEQGRQILYAISENLDTLAGRSNSATETAQRLAARGKKVPM